MQNLLVHVACHPRRKHVMYARGKINLSERELVRRELTSFSQKLFKQEKESCLATVFLAANRKQTATLPSLSLHAMLSKCINLHLCLSVRNITYLRPLTLCDWRYTRELKTVQCQLCLYYTAWAYRKCFKPGSSYRH
jgi:hypothetical protein